MTLYSEADMDAVFSAHESTARRVARQQGRGGPADTAVRRMEAYRRQGINAVVMHIGRKWAVLPRPSLRQFNALYDETDLMKDGATWSKVP